MKSKLVVHQHLPGPRDQVALTVAELLRQQDQPSHMAAKWITLNCKVKKWTKLQAQEQNIPERIESASRRKVLGEKPYIAYTSKFRISSMN